MMATIRRRAFLVLVLFVAGAIVGTLLDQIHVRWGVLSYAHPVFLGQAWWVWPQYGMATVLAYMAARPVVLHQPSLGRSALQDFLWFGGAYFLTALLQAWSAFVLGLLLVTWGARVWRSTGRARIILYSLALACVGTGYEWVLTRAGAFSYNHPDIRGLPIWLPGLYLQAGIFALSLTESIADLPAKK